VIIACYAIRANHAFIYVRGEVLLPRGTLRAGLLL
jgi:NADH:ubiquinone oxidoreductase subunit F (NADH-binding)